MLDIRHETSFLYLVPKIITIEPTFILKIIVQRIHALRKCLVRILSEAFFPPHFNWCHEKNVIIKVHKALKPAFGGL